VTLLRSLLFPLLFYPGTLLYVLAGFPAAAFGTGPLRAVVHGWSGYHSWLLRHVMGIRFVVEGEIPPGPYLIAVKHQSMIETVEALRLVRTPVVVMKRELTVIPLFGWVTRTYGVIGVDRAAGPGALRAMMARGKQAIAEGRPVVIFPEGTRVPVGSAPPLQSGFAGLYRALGLPVVPVALNTGRLWSKGWRKTRGTVRVVVGETIPPGLKRDEVEARVHSAINVLEQAGSTHAG
jgi:1-acyl-sn-glycerol-3-phosphate acyltransferase